MKIEYIRIENFRSIRHLEIDRLSALNVIAGANGSGKTSVLAAVKILLSWLIARLRNPRGRGLAISDNDITRGVDFCTLRLRLDNGVEWQIYKQHSSVRRTPSDETRMTEMTQYANTVAEQVAASPDTAGLTLIDAYGVNRVVDETPMRVRKAHKLSPLDALSVEMSNSVNFHDFFTWYREVEDIENERMRETGTLVTDRRLDAVRRTIADFMDGYGDFRVQRSPKAFVISKGGVKFNFNELSDGEKSYLALVMDISRKLAMTHPAMDDPRKGDGIILIDEIDLHLHPAWQRTVLEKMRRAFPNCQFMITTHSPLVVSGVNMVGGDTLLAIKDGDAHIIEENQYGQEADMVLSDVFGMDSLRPPVVQQHIDRVWELLKAGDCTSPDFDTAFGWLQQHIDAADPVFMQVRMQMALMKKEAGR